MSEKMQAGKKFDLVIAEKVIGLKPWTEQRGEYAYVYFHPANIDPNGRLRTITPISFADIDRRRHIISDVPAYSTTWEGMRLVVEALVEKDMYVELRKFKYSVSCTIRNDMGGIVSEVHKIKTEPHAVCLAALKALEADTHE